MLEIRRFNITLLEKWIWRLGYEKKGLWIDVLVSKYGGWRDLKNKKKSNLDSFWWRDLKDV